MPGEESPGKFGKIKEAIGLSKEAGTHTYEAFKLREAKRKAGNMDCSLIFLELAPTALQGALGPGTFSQLLGNH